MGFRDLIGYQKALQQATLEFKITSKFPKSERFELVDQVKCSSRAVSSNLAGTYGKRSYRRRFISKITDAEMDNYEVGAWDDISFNCNFISNKEYDTLISRNEEVRKLLNYMRTNPYKFMSPSLEVNKVRE